MEKETKKPSIFKILCKGVRFCIFWLCALVLVIGLTAALIAIDAFVAVYLWTEVVPNVFPKLVENGYLAKSVSFETMFWLCTALLVLRPANLGHIFSSKTKVKEHEND